MKKVLIIDDEEKLRGLIGRVVKLEGFDVVVLQADANVPAAVRNEKPDVLFMDVHLSRQSGLEILDELRRSADTNDVPVVMSSGAAVKEECIRRGANGFLLKPFMPDDLITILRQTIQSARRIQK